MVAKNRAGQIAVLTTKRSYVSGDDKARLILENIEAEMQHKFEQDFEKHGYVCFKPNSNDYNLD